MQNIDLWESRNGIKLSTRLALRTPPSQPKRAHVRDLTTVTELTENRTIMYTQHNCERLFSHFSSRGDTSTGATTFLFERSSPAVVVLPPRVQISIK